MYPPTLWETKRARTAGRPKTASEVCQVGQKRPKHMKRDVYTLKEIVTFKKRSGRRHLRYAKWVKRDLNIWKEMYAREKRPLRVKIEVEDDIWGMPNGSKETWTYEKRNEGKTVLSVLSQWSYLKNPSAKEPCISATKTYIFAKQPFPPQKSLISPQMSPVLFPQKGRISLQKNPVFLQNSPT